MKAYIVTEEGYEHTDILGVFFNRKDAEQLANEHTQKILKDWEDQWSKERGAYGWESFLKTGPHDETQVHEYEIQ